MLSMVAKGIADCLRLGPIHKLGGCGVGIQVLDRRGSEPSILHREFHNPGNSSAILKGSICVKSVRIYGVAHKLCDHLGASAQSVLALFKNKHPRSFTTPKSIAIPL